MTTDLEAFHWEWENLSKVELSRRVHHITMHYLTTRLSLASPLGLLAALWCLWGHAWLGAAGFIAGGVFVGLLIPFYLWPWSMNRWRLEPNQWAWELTEIAQHQGQDLSKLKDHETREAIKWCAANHVRRLETEKSLQEIQVLSKELQEMREQREQRELREQQGE